MALPACGGEFGIEVTTPGVIPEDDQGMSKSTYSLKLPASAKKAAAELGRVSGYFVSAREYEELQRLRTFERRVHGITDLPPEIAEAVPGAKMSTVHDHLNALLDESQVGNSGR